MELKHQSQTQLTRPLHLPHHSRTTTTSLRFSYYSSASHRSLIARPHRSSSVAAAAAAKTDSIAEMVKAMRVHEFGGPEVLKWEDVEIGQPKEGEIRVRNKAVGLNFIDTYFRRGIYKAASTPYTPGGVFLLLKVFVSLVLHCFEIVELYVCRNGSCGGGGSCGKWGEGC
ncbi:Quinone oxidoreductase [Linum perenne]